MIAAVALLVGIGTGWAVADSSGSGPTISSDKADYAPGDAVVLTGEGWQAGESVQIDVEDSEGRTWSHQVTVIADEGGLVRDEFALPDWFVAAYSVTATGEASGVATTTFTDGNVYVKSASTTPAGVAVQYKLESWNNESGCPAKAPSKTSTFTITGAEASSVSPAGANSLGANKDDSVRVSFLSAPSGYAFDKWQSVAGAPAANVGNDGAAQSTSTSFCVNVSDSSISQTYVGFVKATLTAPKANAGSDQTVNEGANVSLDGSGSTGATSYSWTQLTGPSVTLTGAATASPSFTAPDGPATLTFRLTATNAAGSTTDDVQVDVKNVAPTVALSGPTAASKYQTKTYTYTVTDPGDPAGEISVTESCGSGATYINTAAANSFDCTFTAVGSPNVKVTANDGDNTGSDSKTVTVSALAPTVVLSGPSAANEGSTQTFTYTVTGAPTTVTESCGANATKTDTPAANSFECTFADGPGSSTVSVSATEDGATGSDSVSVTVANLNPTIALSGPTAANEGQGKDYSYSASDPAGPADPLSVTIDCGTGGSQVADGDSDPTTFRCSFPDGPATSTVKATATDGDGGSASDSKEVTVANVAPSGSAGGPYSGIWGNPISFSGSATDPAGSHDTLTYEWDFEYSGSFSADTTGASPSHTYAAPGNYTAALRVSDEDGGTDSIRTATVSVGTRPTTLTYSGDSSKQYSDVATLTATLLDGSLGVPGKTVTFTIGSQSTTATTNASGVASTTLKITQANGSYTVKSSFAGDADYGASSDSDPFAVTKENAGAYYTGDLFAQTSSATSSTATVALSATIKDITALTGDPAYDADAGEIPYAKVTFVDGSGNPLSTGCSNLPVGLVSSADAKVGTATCNWSASIGSQDSAQFTVGIKVDGRYTRFESTDDVVVTVSKPLGTNFITGGGYLVNQASAGQKAGGAGAKTNFGFNVKYNKAGTNLQGNINVIVRNGSRVYQIKGNSMSSLYVAPSALPSATKPATATFNGKASIQDITNPTAPEGIDGNATLQVTMTDKGEPGSSDTIGLTVWNKAGGLWFASKWDGTRTVEQLLGGGNLVVR